MIVVMISLVIMMTTVMAMLRNTNNALSIMGNIGIKQNALSVADVGVSAARTWLTTVPNTQLNSIQAANGYFETWVPNFDPAGNYNWIAAGNSFLVPSDGGTDDRMGNEVRYVIHRMCNLTGAIDAVGQECVFAPTANSSSLQLGSPAANLGVVNRPLYRITVRVFGPRNVLSFIQVMVY